MGDEVVHAIILVLIVSVIPLGTSMFVGLCASIFQAATQIQEQTLSFVPKLVAVTAVLIICGSWMIGLLVDYFSLILSNL